MRKLIIDFIPTEHIRKIQASSFESIESFELLELLRMDHEDGIKMGLMICHTKDDVDIDDVKLPDNVQIVSVLKSEGNKHTCMVKVEVPKEFEQMLTEFKLDLIWTTPTIVRDGRITYSCIGENEDIAKYLEIMGKYGKVENMRFKKATYQEHDILSVLTEKQREVLMAAKKYGYYDYPKKINSEELSKKVNLSKATLLQHLRKAEERLMENITAGYE